MTKSIRHSKPLPPPPVPWMARRGTVLLAGLLLFLFIFFANAGAAWAPALYHLLTDVPLVLLWLAAMLGAGVWVAKLFKLRDERFGVATLAALGIGSFSLLLLLLGWAGVLNRGLAWILTAASVVLGLVHLIGEKKFNPDRIATSLRERADWTEWVYLIAVPFLALAVLAAFIPPGLLWGDEPNGYDVVEYHLQIPREWYEAARIIPLHHNVFSYFPFNVELHYLLAMLLRGGPWAGMYIAQLMHVAMIVLAVLAVKEFAGGRLSTDQSPPHPNPLPRSTAGEGTRGVLFAATTPWLTLLAPVAYNEGGLLLFGTLAIGFTWRAISTPEARGRRMLLAGVMAGFACGVKLTAAPMLLVAIPIAFLVALFLQNKRGFLKPIAAFLLGGLLVFSPWLIRNFIWTHNPVFPEAMSIFGRAHFTPEQAERWHLAYVPRPDQRSIDGRLKAAWEQIAADWRYGFVILPAGLFAFWKHRRRPASLFLIALLLMWLVFWLGFTHLQSRFFVLAIPVMALLISQVELPIANLALTCGLVAQAGFGLLNLHDHFHRFIARFGDDWPRVVGLEHYAPMQEPRGLVEVEAGAGMLTLAGDAQAFLYEMPMSRLHYRTVFDVDGQGRDSVDAWLDAVRPAEGDTLLIDYGYIRNAGVKYHGIRDPGGIGQGRVIVNIGEKHPDAENSPAKQ